MFNATKTIFITIIMVIMVFIAAGAAFAVSQSNYLSENEEIEAISDSILKADVDNN